MTIELRKLESLARLTEFKVLFVLWASVIGSYSIMQLQFYLVYYSQKYSQKQLSQGSINVSMDLGSKRS